jgi:hypothetical protein
MTDWVPVLVPSNDTTTRALEAVDAIADAITNRTFLMGEVVTKRQNPYDEALLFAYLAVVRNDMDWADRAIQCLNSAVDQAAKGTPHAGLFGGFSGLGWTLEHVSMLLARLPLPQGEAPEDDCGSLSLEGREDLNQDVDIAVLRALRKIGPLSCYDLISGLVGLGVYLFERWPNENAQMGIQEVFDHLERMAQVSHLGITWHTGPDLLPEWQRKDYPSGYFNLGVAHGIPGIIHFLSQVSTSGIVDPKRSHRLLEGAMSWLISQQRPPGSRSRFSSWIAPEREPGDSRLTWCYGDLGILAVVLQVARRSGRADWSKFSGELLAHCLAWPADSAGAEDAPLCHGAAGIAHIFNRIYQSERDDRCLAAAVNWYERTLAMRKPGTGVGGFCSRTVPKLDGPSVWEPNPAFLDGSIGIALALLAATAPIEPCWDRALLLSTRSLANSQ